jgi:hypothetical protein
VPTATERAKVGEMPRNLCEQAKLRFQVMVGQRVARECGILNEIES